MRACVHACIGAFHHHLRLATPESTPCHASHRRSSSRPASTAPRIPSSAPSPPAAPCPTGANSASGPRSSHWESRCSTRDTSSTTPCSSSRPTARRRRSSCPTGSTVPPTRASPCSPPTARWPSGATTGATRAPVPNTPLFDQIGRPAPLEALPGADRGDGAVAVVLIAPVRGNAKPFSEGTVVEFKRLQQCLGVRLGNPCARKSLPNPEGQHRASNQRGAPERVGRLHRPGMNAVLIPDPLVRLAAAATIRGPPHRRIDRQAERLAPADDPLDGFIYGGDRRAFQSAGRIQQCHTEAVLPARIGANPATHVRLPPRTAPQPDTARRPPMSSCARWPIVMLFLRSARRNSYSFWNLGQNSPDAPKKCPLASPVTDPPHPVPSNATPKSPAVTDLTKSTPNADPSPSATPQAAAKAKSAKSPPVAARCFVPIPEAGWAAPPGQPRCDGY